MNLKLNEKVMNVKLNEKNDGKLLEVQLSGKLVNGHILQTIHHGQNQLF
jgi:hypothetical protein